VGVAAAVVVVDVERPQPLPEGGKKRIEVPAVYVGVADIDHVADLIGEAVQEADEFVLSEKRPGGAADVLHQQEPAVVFVEAEELPHRLTGPFPGQSLAEMPICAGSGVEHHVPGVDGRREGDGIPVALQHRGSEAGAFAGKVRVPKWNVDGIADAPSTQAACELAARRWKSFQPSPSSISSMFSRRGSPAARRFLHIAAIGIVQNRRSTSGILWLKNKKFQ
jgi:hypothetical protein